MNEALGAFQAVISNVSQRRHKGTMRVSCYGSIVWDWGSRAMPSVWGFTVGQDGDYFLDGHVQ